MTLLRLGKFPPSHNIYIDFVQVQAVQKLKENIGRILKDNLKVKMNKIGEGDFDCEESDVRRMERRTQLAVQEERIQQAILENKAAEKETNEKLNTIDRDTESGDSLETTNNQVIIETGVESLSQQIVESLLMTLSEQGEIEMCRFI